MGFREDIKRLWFNVVHLDEILSGGIYEKLEKEAGRRDYYLGNQKRQIETKWGQADDNLTLNFVGLIVERGISMLLGQGIDFDMPGDPIEQEDPETGETVREDQPNQQYIDAVWRANKRDILLHKVGQFGGVHGTCYLKIVPDGTADKETGEDMPRLIAIDPLYVEVDPMPEDIDTVLRYTIRFAVKVNDKWVGRKEVTERVQVLVDSEGNATEDPTAIAGMMDKGWEIVNFIKDDNGQWREISREAWEFEFPPIVHWQNLPLAGNVYGMPDINDNVIEIQDAINLNVSKINRIIRYHSHPKTWGRNAGQSDQTTWGADEMVLFQSDNAMLQNLEMQSDLGSSLNFLAFIQKALFKISRTVDIESMEDKLGALTNFALRVLFFDSLAKLHTKQELYGEALTEINHRLLVLQGGFEDTNGGEVIWPDPLPESEAEEITGLTFDIQNGLASKETIATERGYDWINEQKRIKNEREQADMMDDSIGSRILREFNRGFGNNGEPVDERIGGTQQ